VNQRRNIQLDFLRGVAILLVFGRHLEIARPGGGVGVFADLWFRIGWLGVDLFFVLSGFLIGGLLLSEYAQHGKIDISRFLVRRGLKIYPPYLAFLAYLILVPCAKVWANGGAVIEQFGMQWEKYWPNFLFLQNYVGTNPAGHTWTLAVEEHFYLLLPLVLFYLARNGAVRLMLPISLAVMVLCLTLRCLAIWSHDAYALKMSASHLRLDALLFGVGLRGVAQFHPKLFEAFGRRRVLLVIAGLALWAPNLFIEPGTVLIRTIGLTATFLGAGALLLATYHSRTSDFGRLRVIVHPFVRVVAWIGFYSYAVYLWHVTAIGILERTVAGRLSNWIGVENPWWWVLSVTLVSFGAIAAGVIASKLIEWPVLRIRDRYFPTRSGTLPAGVAAPPVGNPALTQPVERPTGVPSYETP
jgi:peptidoglycan/LPS O-acetylase OafA/YrhL